MPVLVIVLLVLVLFWAYGAVLRRFVASRRRLFRELAETTGGRLVDDGSPARPRFELLVEDGQGSLRLVEDTEGGRGSRAHTEIEVLLPPGEGRRPVFACHPRGGEDEGDGATESFATGDEAFDGRLIMRVETGWTAPPPAAFLEGLSALETRLRPHGFLASLDGEGRFRLRLPARVADEETLLALLRRGRELAGAAADWVRGEPEGAPPRG